MTSTINNHIVVIYEGVRDYIHVMDLAVGHVAAVQKIADPNFNGWKAYNLGTGKGNSVLEVVEAYKNASGKEIPYDIAPRRAGDIAASFADCRVAEKELKWTAKKSLQDMCKCEGMHTPHTHAFVTICFSSNTKELNHLFFTGRYGLVEVAV